MFGLADGRTECLYDALRLEIEPGQVVAVIGPSGAGKSVLLAAVRRRAAGGRALRPAALARSPRPAVDLLTGGALAERLAVLSRCGMADAAALVTPAKHLSGGQRYRLALAEAIWAAYRSRRPSLIVADEFAATLDDQTAGALCRRLRRLLAGGDCALLVATARPKLLAAIRPDQVVVKPLGRPGFLLRPARAPRARWGGGDPRRWPIRRGTLRDYEAMAGFHYLAGPPAAHKRVYVIRPRGPTGPAAVEAAAVLVVSPPVFNVRGRNRATGGRYAGADRAAALALLNAEMECISRVIVHPVYRGCGLAVRLVRHAVASARTPLIEAMAAMGTVHPFFEKAGMTAWRVGLDVHLSRLVSAAEAVGLGPDDLAAVAPVRRLLARRSRAARFLRREIDLCVRRTLCAKRLSRLADPVAEVCRRTGRQYVYYIAAAPRGAS
jgi:ABC-type ATPase with predicted acetyltransferase domain